MNESNPVWGTVTWAKEIMMRVQVGAMWQIRLNDACAAAMCLYVKLP